MRNVDFVLYTSKLCNLRCSYCYEYPLLADRARMSHEQLERMFTHVREYLDRQNEAVLVRFQWHGGEPMLIDPSYYWDAFATARRIFAGSEHQVQHTTQSNFTVLDDARIELMKHGFTSVGISLDLHSGLRVNKQGQDQEHRTLANLDRALEAGVKPVGISVLSRKTLKRLRHLYEFYRSRGMGFRVLPLEKGLQASGQGFELTPAETLAALCELADLWFADDQMVPVEPLLEHMRLLIAARTHPHLRLVHDKRAWEPCLLVDTNGRLFGYTNYMDDAHALGNIFTTPLTEIMHGKAQQDAASAAEKRVAATCSSCHLYGNGCTGYAIAESEVSVLEQREDGALDCSVTRPLLRYLESKLRQGGVLDADGQLTPAMREAQRAHVHLEVSHGA